MDPLERTTLATNISRLQQKAYKDDEVLPLLTEAHSALKARNWAKAKANYNKAVKLYDEPVPVAKLLAQKVHRLQSVAAAKRAIAAGDVLVDGKVPHVDATATSGTEITYQGREVK